MRQILTIGDFVILGLLVSLILISFFALDSLVGQGSEVFVEVKGEVVYRTDLSADSQFEVTGEWGSVRIQVSDGAVAVVSAECPNRVCVRTGWRNRTGELIVCVPNRTIVRISGSSSGVRVVTG